MKIYDYSTHKLFIFGDIHGEFNNFFEEVKRRISPTNKETEKEPSLSRELLDLTFTTKTFDNSPFNKSVIIVAGDCGFGFNKMEYYTKNFSKVNEALRECDTHILFMRGNHDDPSYFAEEKIQETNIKTIPDYSIVKTSEGTTLCVGGAISVDRVWRKQQEHRLNKYAHNNNKKLYWDGENVIFNEEELKNIVNEGIQIDSVITHTCPSFCFPEVKGMSLSWFRIDSSLNDDIKAERETLSHLHDYLTKECKFTLKFWAYGHFHEHSQVITNNTLFALIGENRHISPLRLYTELKMYEEIKKNKKKDKVKPFLDIHHVEWTPDRGFVNLDRVVGAIHALEENNIENERDIEDGTPYNVDEIMEEIRTVRPHEPILNDAEDLF